MSELLDEVPNVIIDECGIFKYILIKLYDDANNASKIVMRGNMKFNRHANIFDEFTSQLSPSLRAECIGGGYIKHDSNKKTMCFFGYSERYGPVNSVVSIDLALKKYRDYTFTQIHDDE